MVLPVMGRKELRIKNLGMEGLHIGLEDECGCHLVYHAFVTGEFLFLHAALLDGVFGDEGGVAFVDEVDGDMREVLFEYVDSHLDKLGGLGGGRIRL